VEWSAAQVFVVSLAKTRPKRNDVRSVTAPFLPEIFSRPYPFSEVAIAVVALGAAMSSAANTKHDRPRDPTPGAGDIPWRWVGAIVLFAVALAVYSVHFLKSRAEPILRARIIETLSARFKGKVEMASFHVWVDGNLSVSGEGLKVYGQNDPNTHQPGIQPLIGIEEFHFQTGLLNLLRSPMHVHTVKLKGLVLNIPPAGDRQQMDNIRPENGKVRIYVDEFLSEDAQLIINTSRPDKLPLEFSIGNLKMEDIGAGQPLRFQAELVNPKPVGIISSSGTFGPWQADRPRDTPVKGNYSFTNADLGTIKGLGGVLSSTGQYAGSLGSIVVEGETNAPDFRLSVSGHPVPLRTVFHAIVDGTSGNTYLQPVKAKLLDSSLVAKGSVIRAKGLKGHQIALDVWIDNARIEDLLHMGVRTDPPIMTGAIQSKTKFLLVPGTADVANRIRLTGNFEILAAHFTSDKVQRKIDELSLRSQGKAKLAKASLDEEVQSDLSGVFNLKNGVLSFSELHFQVPGTRVDMTGVYGLDGNTFDFHGKASLDATLSRTMTGWKSVLLKPVDPFFRKNGAGTEVPFKITGTRSEPHFGLDFGHHENKNAQVSNRP